MQSEVRFTRRHFVKTATAVAVLALGTPTGLLAQQTKGREVVAFDKPLNFLSHDELAAFMADLGFSGIELTLRPKGRVTPEKVEEELPRVVEAMKKRNLTIPLFASGIDSVEAAHAEKTLRTAARLGVKRYRMLWYKYDLQKPILPQLDAFQKKLSTLAALNREIGVTALYQNHAGANLVGAPLWDIYSIIKDIDSKEVAMAFDIRHATVEGANAWALNYNLVKAKIDTLYFKDCLLEGQKIKNVPLGDGMVDKKFFEMIKGAAFPGPLSLHVEYLDGKTDRKVFAEAFKRDLEKLKSWL